MTSDPNTNPYRPPETSSRDAEAIPPQPRTFRPSGSVAAVFTVVLWIAAGAAGIATLVWAVAWAASIRWPSPVWVTDVAVLMTIMGLISHVSRLAIVVLACMWFFRVYTNVQRRFLVAGLRYSPVWASGAFLVPVLNAFVPYRITREIWIASHPGIRTVTGSKAAALGSGIVPLWWGFVLSLHVVFFATTTSIFLGLYVTNLIYYFLTIPAAIATTRLVREIEDLQRAKAESAPEQHEGPEAERESGVIHRCPSCGVPYNPDDYSPYAAHLYCTTCNGEIPRVGIATQ